MSNLQPPAQQASEVNDDRRFRASLTHPALDIPCDVVSQQRVAPFLQAPRAYNTGQSLNTRTCLRKSRGVWGPAPKENNARLLPKNEFKNDFESVIDKN
jgi:hypothetical protein